MLSRDLHPFSAVTRELPNNVPYIVKKQYIGTVVKQWKRPSRQLFDFARRELDKHVKSQINDHFSKYAYGHLKQRVSYALCYLRLTPHLSLMAQEHLERSYREMC